MKSYMKRTVVNTTLAVVLAATPVFAAASDAGETVIGTAQIYNQTTQDTAKQPAKDAPKQDAANATMIADDLVIGNPSIVTKTLTYEDAVSMAKENSTKLRGFEDQAEYLQELKEDIWDMTGSFAVSPVTHQTWVSPEVYGIYSSIQNITSGMVQNKYGKEITNLTLEATVKNYFTSLFSDESSLELAKADAKVKKELYEQGQRKNELGMLSQYKLDMLKNDYEQSKLKVDQLSIALQQEYAAFYDLIGKQDDEHFTLLYDTVYAPYEMQDSLEHYIDSQLNTDYTIKIRQQALEDAQFSKNYMSEMITSTQQKTNAFSYDEAKRALKTAKDQKKLAIKNAYNNLQQIETQYETAQNARKQAESALHVAQVNYKVGYATKIAVEQAELAVIQAKNAVRQLEYAHDMQIYQFENTELLGSGQQA